MIKINFTWAMAGLATIFPILVLWSWIFYTKIKSKNLAGDSSDLEQCPFCTYLFFDFDKRHFKNCPRCHSLIGREEKAQLEKLMQRKKLSDNESGVILVTVILLTIVLSIVAIGIMSLNVSQVQTASTVVDSVTAEQLATGLFYQNYQQKFDGVGNTPTNMTIGTKTYTITHSETPNSGPNTTNQLQFNLAY